MSYINHTNCKLRQKHREVLFKLIENWEDNYWNKRPNNAAFDLTSNAKFEISLMLLVRLNTLFSNTIDFLYCNELEKHNPILKINPDFAPEKLKNEVSEELKVKLCDNPELLFTGRDKLRDYYTEIVRQHTDVVNEILDRIARDKDDICSAFFDGRKFSQIDSLSAEGSDCHFKGNRTTVIETDCGKFLYKPHSLKNDVILRSMTHEFFPDTLIIPKALDYDSYGYSEFINLKQAEGEEEAKAFIRRLGGMSAIIHMLGSNDLHVENILSCGAYPALVDSETMLLPSISIGTEADNDYDCFKVTRDMDASLMKSGLLPRMNRNEEYSPYLSSGKKSILPIVSGQVRTVIDYLPEFEEGFRNAYHICLNRKSELSGVIQSFSSAQMRMLLRNTIDYSKFLQRLYTVTALSSQEVTDKLYQNLRMECSNFTDAQNNSITMAEEEELADGNIPYFNLPGSSHSLYSGDRLVAENVFYRSPVENALNHLNRMSADECEFELALLRNSLNFAKIRSDNEIAASFQPLKFTEDDYRAEADNILQDIQKNCVKTVSGNYVWFGMMENAEGGTFSHLPPDFLLGTLGMALFCAEYYSVFGDESAKDTAEKAASIAESYSAFMLNHPEKLSGTPIPMNPGSTIRTFLRLGDMLHEEKYITLARKLTANLSTFPENFLKELDYYSGAAGLLYTLCADERLFSCKDFSTDVKKLADKLIEYQTLKKEDGLFGWDTIGKGRLISGLGHGQMGIGLALYMAYLYTGDNQYKRSAEDALEIEHRLYSEKIGNWPDFRESLAADRTVNGICSGAPGIGLAYLKLDQHGLHDEYLSKAIEAVLKAKPAFRDHLCCGNAGTVEFLIEAGRVLHDEKLYRAADERICQMLSRKNKNGSFRFLPRGYRDCKPFNISYGVSGLGHILLRRISEKTACYLL